MSIGEVSFDGNKIEVRGKWIALEYPIQDAFLEDDRVFVLFEPNSGSGAFANVICVGMDGSRLWVAELPEGGREDYYYLISTKRPLVVNSFSSYKCEIDRATGKIVSKEFVK